MEELTSAVDRIADSLGSNLPLWASIAGLVVPIVLTIVTIILSVRMDQQNKQLQKVLSNRDTINQTRQCVLDIYNAYLTALNITCQANGNVAGIFVSDQYYYRWEQDVRNADVAIIGAYNRAKLMLENEALITEMEKARDAFSQLARAISSYIYTGIPSQIITNAWVQFSVQYNVQTGNYYALTQNRILGEAFAKLCETSYTKDIQDKMSSYIGIVGTDAFDKVFKKYVQIKEL